MNPRTVLAALGALAIYGAGATGVAVVNHAQAEAAQKEVRLLKINLDLIGAAAESITEAAKLRAETAERAVVEARRAGAANRAEADRLLALQPPAGMDQCAAAEQLLEGYAR